MPIIAARGISKAYGSRVLLRSADLVVRSGERVGVIGRNGTGKTTLGKILAGLEPPDQGQLICRRGARIEMLEQVPHLEPALSADEAVAEGLKAWTEAARRHQAVSEELTAGRGDMDALVHAQQEAGEDVERLGGWDQSHRVRSLLELLGIRQVTANVGQMSGGEQRRVAMARLLISRPDLAIMDEPTNHLDADTIEWLETYLVDEYQGALVLITHDRYLLDNVAQRTAEISDGEVYVFDGGYGRFLEQKAERDEQESRTEQNRQNFLRREIEWLRRMPKARTTKQAARIDRAEAAIAAPKPKVEKTAQLALEVTRSGKTLLELHEFGVSIGERVLCRPFNWTLLAGERVGIVGPNGAGKTTFLRALLGTDKPSTGTAEFGKNTKVAYLDQQRTSLDDSANVFENVVGDQTKIVIGGQPIEPYSYLERFGFFREMMYQPVASLSGGERARVALARLLRQSANLLVLDEPTNDLDVSTLGALESMLVDSGASVLIVTHDRWLLDRVATSLLVWDTVSSEVSYHVGNYSTYRRLQLEQRADSAPPPARSNKRESAPLTAARAAKAKKKSLSFAELKELETLPDAIETAERRVNELMQQLSDPTTYASGGTNVTQLQRDLEAAKPAVERLMKRWEELESKRNEGDVGA
jgi:ABC transport system ATP-binding/permease protein